MLIASNKVIESMPSSIIYNHQLTTPLPHPYKGWEITCKER